MNKAQINALYARKLRSMARERRHDQRPEPLTAHGGRGVARAGANGATDGLPQKDFTAKGSPAWDATATNAEILHLLKKAP